MRFQKILIANRGEIACRIIQTAKRLGIKTVAVYSTEDAQSLHVRMADESVCIGPAHPLKSYLNIPNLLSAMEATGAEACHPGYGFLSESNRFHQAILDHGATFIGPNIAAMEQLGDKIQSKVIAKEAGVSFIPGFEGQVLNIEHAHELANQIGFPVILKASAGGGGKGMRVVYQEFELESAWKLTCGEALSSFGDDRLLLEKFIRNSRHIEVQVLGDKHGNVVYLPERECSIQRRNQKILEETPSPFIDDNMRIEMGEQASLLAKNVGYDSAGTCEFLVDPSSGQFYFLEMNTRLQVEHPITEYVTGLDLVEQMILSASGEKLAFKQSDVGRAKGFAIEARVYAEHPSTFLPSSGTLERLSLPSNASIFECGKSAVRCDTAVEQGSVISTHYDNLIGKICTFDSKSRSEAISKMQVALDELVVSGLSHNTPLLRDITENKAFKAGETTTNFIKNEYPSGFQGRSLSLKQRNDLAATAAVLYHDNDSTKYRLFNFHEEKIQTLYYVSINGCSYSRVQVSVDNSASLSFKVQSEGDSVNYLRIERESTNLVRAEFRGAIEEERKRSHLYQYHPSSQKSIHSLSLQFQGTMFVLDVKTPDQYKALQLLPKPSLSPKDLSLTLKAPMPGTIISTLCSPGQLVIKNQELCVIEAMKMQNILRAPISGIVESVFVEQGQVVQPGEKLVHISSNAILEE